MREPQSNGIADRFVRILKENLLWVRRFRTVEELRQALLAFKETLACGPARLPDAGSGPRAAAGCDGRGGVNLGRRVSRKP